MAIFSAFHSSQIRFEPLAFFLGRPIFGGENPPPLVSLSAM